MAVPDLTQYDPGRPLSELRDTGLLWLVNRVALHPRGFALALHMTADGEVTGWSLQGDGLEPYVFASPTDDQMFHVVEGYLAGLSKRARDAARITVQVFELPSGRWTWVAKNGEGLTLGGADIDVDEMGEAIEGAQARFPNADIEVHGTKGADDATE